MKNGTYIVLGLALAGLTGCVDLNEKLVGSITTQYISTGAGLDAAVLGDYSQLRSFFGREESFAVTEFGTDIETNGDQGSYIYENTYAGGLNSADGHYQFPWNSFYRNINTSNAVIGRAPSVTDMDPATKATRIAEAKFLRALSYFWLVQMYGPVPLTTTESQGASNLAHRSPVDSVYLQTVEDLREAIPDLPVTASAFGRATKGAARDLLARVLLTRAYHTPNGAFAYEFANPTFYLSGATFLREAGATAATDFASAKAEADSIIPAGVGGGLGLSGNYSLLPNYVDIFCAPMGTRGPGSYCALPANEQNAEIIYSVQFSAVPGQYTVNLGNTNFVQTLSFYDDRQGMTRNCWDGRAFRRARPTLFARNLWQRWTDSTHTVVLDTRYDGTFQSVWYANAANTGGCYQSQAASRMAGYTAGTCTGGSLPTFGTNCTNGAAFVTGDTAIFQPGYILGGAASCTAAGCSQAQRQAVKYAIYEPCVAEPCPNQTTIGQYDIFRYPTMKKWQDDQRPDYNNQDGGRDVILQRLGETYLTAAEAACAAPGGAAGTTCTGSQSAILPYLQTLRQRAAVGAANKAMIIDAAHMPATIDLEYIMDERGRETYGEYARWLDLARTGLWHRVVDYNRQASAVNFNPGAPGFFTEAKHHLRPIPQAQIDLTAGGVQSFPQNPGY
jgi:hypothetical protein